MMMTLHDLEILVVAMLHRLEKLEVASVDDLGEPLDPIIKERARCARICDARAEGMRRTNIEGVMTAPQPTPYLSGVLAERERCVAILRAHKRDFDACRRPHAVASGEQKPTWTYDEALKAIEDQIESMLQHIIKTGG